MVKVEGVYRDFERVGQEVLLDEKGFELLAGDGKKEKLFEGLDEDIDFSLFLHHVNFVREKGFSGYTFVNLKPSTLIKYSREIMKVIRGKVVVEIREDHVGDRELEEIKRMRENFPFLLSLDDFGKKSSNLDRVLHLKPNFIKVDVSLFESRLDFLNFVNFLSSYSGGAVLIAERVETKEQFKMVRSAGIRFWQGWFERELS